MSLKAKVVIIPFALPFNPFEALSLFTTLAPSKQPSELLAYSKHAERAMAWQNMQLIHSGTTPSCLGHS